MDKLSALVLVVSVCGVVRAKSDDDSYLDALRRSHDAETINGERLWRLFCSKSLSVYCESAMNIFFNNNKSTNCNILV